MHKELSDHLKKKKERLKCSALAGTINAVVLNRFMKIERTRLVETTVHLANRFLYGGNDIFPFVTRGK